MSSKYIPGTLQTSYLKPGDRVVGKGRLTPVQYAVTLHAMPGPGAEHDGAQWPLIAWQLEERLHAPYRLDLSLAAPDPAIDVDGLVGGRVVLAIDRGHNGRRIHGVVRRAALLGPHADGALVGLEVGPALALCDLGEHSRVFQGKTVLEVVEAVVGPALGSHGSGIEHRLQGQYVPRDYCVQFRESDLAFVSRILAEEGITLLFDHDGDAERIVLVDAPESFPFAGDEPLADRGAAHPPALPWVLDRPEEAPTESVQTARRARDLRPARWKTSRWDWKVRPVNLLAAVAPSRQPHAFGEAVSADERRPNEGEERAGPIVDDSIDRARRLRELDDARSVRLRAETNATVLRAGSVFELTSPPTEALADEWLVIRVVHRGHAPDATLHADAEGAGAGYENEIEALPVAVPYRPDIPRKPLVSGVQTARVIDPDDELIRTDQQGRIRVRMLWDEQQHEQSHSSCWLRVAQPWAGDGFGTVFLPRNGSEVVVTFIDGDPDRPLCLGCVYNGSAAPPYSLPDDRTRTVIRTQSTDGVGFNELSFEDGQGIEEVFLQAQRNLRELVKAAHSTSVGASQALSVGTDRTKSIGGSETTTIGEDQQIRVEGVRGTHIAGSEATFVGGGPAKSEAGVRDVAIGSSELRVEGKRYVWARDELVLEVGSQGSATTKITLTPTGITIVASESFNVTIGGKAQLDIVPTVHKVVAETIKALAKSSSLKMHADVHVESDEAIVLKQSDTCFARLDGSVTIEGGEVALGAGGKAELIGAEVALESTEKQVSITGAAGVSIDSPANVTVNAGGEATVKGTIVRGN